MDAVRRGGGEEGEGLTEQVLRKADTWTAAGATGAAIRLVLHSVQEREGGSDALRVRNPVCSHRGSGDAATAGKASHAALSATGRP